jgi:molybdenum cofactor cytidylyltransferase
MIVGILLAAGASSRFGSKKILHLVDQGVPMGVLSAHNLASAVDRVLVVVQPEDESYTRLVQQAGWLAVPCLQWREGMGASLACGVRASSDADGWLVALADMPFILPETIGAVAQALRGGAPLAAPVSDGRRGHPVGFACEYRSELCTLSGDIGARDILARDHSRIELLAVEDAGIHRDIDSRADLDRPGGDSY